MRSRAITVAPGVEIAPEALLRRLITSGYRSVAEVGEMGEVSRRGGLIDVFGPGMGQPVRVEFDGDTVHSMRAFDVSSQRSTGPVERTRLTPAREIIFADDLDERLRPIDGRSAAGDPPAEELEWRRIRELVHEGVYFEGLDWMAPLIGIPMAPLLDYLPAGAALWVDEPDAVERELATAAQEIERLEPDARKRAHHLPERGALFEPPDRVLAGLERFTRVAASLGVGPGAREDAITLEARPQPPFGRKLDLLRGELRRLADLGYERVIVCDNRGQADRLEEILGDRVVSVDVGSVTGGFVLPAA